VFHISIWGLKCVWGANPAKAPLNFGPRVLRGGKLADIV